MADKYTVVYVEKGQAQALNLLVKQRDILVTGFGTIGNVRLVSKFQTGSCYANNVCRIRLNPKVLSGYIYAFLSSKYGHAQLNKNASGSVVRYIESPGIKKTLIPALPQYVQETVNKLVLDSVQLRENATTALSRVHEIFTKEISIKVKPKSHSVSIKEIFNQSEKRFEGTIYADEAQAILEAIFELFKYKTVGELALNIFNEGIFKREYVEKGHPFMMGSDIMKAIPTASKFISYKQALKKQELFVKEGWILMTCSGSVGDVVYVDKQLTPFIYTHDLIRIVPRDDDEQLYLFGFLSSPIGKKLVNHYKYGSVIQHLEAFHVSGIPVPILYDYKQEIISNVRTYVEANYEAKMLELQAISMVEAEIEKWNKA